jgi:hypothetical protein
VNITEVLGSAISATNPVFTCLVSNGGSACITIPDAVVVDLDTVGTQNVQGFPILIEGSGGGQAVSSSVPLPVVTTATSVMTPAGNVAHDNADSGNPIKIGGKASTTVPSAVTPDDRVNAWYTLNGAAVVVNADPCGGRYTKEYFPFDITASGTAEITPSLSGSGNYWYICAFNILTTAANNVNLVDDNSDNCASVTASLISSGLAAGDGWGFGANGGMAQGAGSGTVLRSVTTNSVLCLVSSASTELHGTFVAVAAP